MNRSAHPVHVLREREGCQCLEVSRSCSKGSAVWLVSPAFAHTRKRKPCTEIRQSVRSAWRHQNLRKTDVIFSDSISESMLFLQEILPRAYQENDFNRRSQWNAAAWILPRLPIFGPHPLRIPEQYSGAPNPAVDPRCSRRQDHRTLPGGSAMCGFRWEQQ